MKQLPEAFVARMEKMLGPSDAPAFFACYEGPPRRGLRVNTLRLSPGAFAALSPFPLEPTGILPEGFLLVGSPGLGSHPYHLAGMFYLQEPSAMAPIAALGVQPGMRVLDVCAAPGGKSGGIAARLRGQGLLVANEVVPGRAKTLRYTLERLGVCNAAVTCARPEALCEALAGYFDAVLVDAPCSGEGMFRKDEGAVAAWSEAHVRACAQRQKAILESASQAVAEGGALVYSTCTFSPEENEGVVEAFAAAHPGFTVEYEERLYPHTCPGEGHFVARLRRLGRPHSQEKQARLPLPPCKEAAYKAFCAEALEAPPEGEAVCLNDGRVLVLPGPLPQGLGRARLLTAGVYAGDLAGGRFQPSHALAMAAGLRWHQALSPGEGELGAYLHGQVIPAQGAQKGWCRVEVEGCPLGLGKVSEGVLKNHLPKGLRLI